MRTLAESPIHAQTESPCHAFVAFGSDNLVITTLTSCVLRTIVGLQGEQTLPALGNIGTVPAADITSGGVTHVRGYTSWLDYTTRWTTLFAECDDSYTDSSDPTQNYTATSSIVGGGQCPQNTSGHQWFQDPFDTNPFDWDIGGGNWKITSGTRTLTRTFSSPIDIASKFSQMKSNMLGLPLNSSGRYDDAPQAIPNTDFSSLNPADYSGDLIVIGSGGGIIGSFFGAAAACGWNIETIDAYQVGMAVQRQKATVRGSGRYYFWIGLCEQGISADVSPTTRITFLFDGYITNGQSIGLAEDGADHVITFPDDPFPIQALGDNALVRRYVFAVINQTVDQFLTSQRLHLGDNG